MLKLMLMSVLFATFLLPAAAASSRRPRSALRNLVIAMLLGRAAPLAVLCWAAATTEDADVGV